MGIQSRDYFRDSSAPSSFGRGGSNVVKWLIVINAVVFVLQAFTERTQLSVTQWLVLSPEGLLHGQLWRLVTYAFCHGDIWHIFFNMLFLFFFGRTLEAMYGSREFLWLYMTAAVIAALVYIVLGLAMGGLGPMLGASGAVMAVLMVFALYFPRQTIYIWGIVPVEIRWLVAFFVVVDLLPVLQGLAGRGPHDGVAHSAHLGGLAFGYFYQRNQLRLSQLFGQWRLPRLSGPRRRSRSRKEFKIYQPAPDETADTSKEFDRQVDEILDKIRVQGEASLTPHERELLKEASQRYKNR